MGKVKKLRQKYHISLKKSKSLNNLPETIDKIESNQSDINLFKSSENIFAGVNISLDELTKSLPPDFDARSILSTKSLKELKKGEKQLKKKEKQKLRHERFLQKLEFTHQAIQNSKLKKKKQVKPKPYNNMNSLLDALPSLDSLTSDVSRKNFEKPKGKPKKGILKAKHLLKQQSIDSKIFNKILDNKKFKANPFETISEYLKQRISNEL